MIYDWQKYSGKRSASVVVLKGSANRSLPLCVVATQHFKMNHWALHGWVLARAKIQTSQVKFILHWSPLILAFSNFWEIVFRVLVIWCYCLYSCMYSVGERDKYNVGKSVFLTHCLWVESAYVHIQKLRLMLVSILYYSSIQQKTGGPSGYFWYQERKCCSQVRHSSSQ